MHSTSVQNPGPGQTDRKGNQLRNRIQGQIPRNVYHARIAMCPGKTYRPPPPGTRQKCLAPRSAQACWPGGRGNPPPPGGVGPSFRSARADWSAAQKGLAQRRNQCHRALSQRNAASAQVGGRPSENGSSPVLRTPSSAKAPQPGKSAQPRRLQRPRGQPRSPGKRPLEPRKLGRRPHRKSRLSPSNSAPSAHGCLRVSDTVQSCSLAPSTWKSCS